MYCQKKTEADSCFENCFINKLIHKIVYFRIPIRTMRNEQSSEDESETEAMSPVVVTENISPKRPGKGDKCVISVWEKEVPTSVSNSQSETERRHNSDRTRNSTTNKTRTMDFTSVPGEQYNNDLDANDSDSELSLKFSEPSNENVAFQNLEKSHSGRVGRDQGGVMEACKGKKSMSDSNVSDYELFREENKETTAPFVFSRWAKPNQVLGTVFSSSAALQMAPHRTAEETESLDLD